MDDRKFDDLTRFIGKRASRRAILKGAIAAGLAAAVGRSVDDGNVAEASTPSRGGVKFRVKSFCTQAGSACRNTRNPTRRCCYKCNNSTKKCCEAEGFSCRYDSDCCDGRICRDPNLFDDEVVKGCFAGGTLEYGAECLSGDECASGNCVNGVCCTSDQTCEYGSTCCSPDEPCTQDVCCPIEQVCVVDPYDPSSNECCDPYYEQCSVDGCCPIADACVNEVEGYVTCCDSDVEYCHEDSYVPGYRYCVPSEI